MKNKPGTDQVGATLTTQNLTFCVSESFGYRKILGLLGEYHDFL